MPTTLLNTAKTLLRGHGTRIQNTLMRADLTQRVLTPKVLAKRGSTPLAITRVGAVLIVGFAITSYLVGCASGPTKLSQSTASQTTTPPPVVASAKPVQRAQTPANQGSTRNTPIADKPINLAGQCSQTEEDGFREQAKLDVQGNEVKALDWKMWIGKRGSCSFNGAEFSQTQRRPHIELIAKDGSQCKLMIWQTPERVTLAHANCQNRCSPGVYDDAWPVMFHPKTGVCARVG